MVSEKLYNALWAELALSRCSSISLCRRSNRTRAAGYRLPISAGNAPACLFPSKHLKFPLLWGKEGEGGAGQQAQRSFWKGRAGISRRRPRARPRPCAGKRSRETRSGMRWGEQIPTAGRGLGSTHPAAASRSPRSPGAGRASLRPRTAARSLRTRARSLPLPQHRAVFLAALPLSPSCRALLLPLKRGDAGGWCAADRRGRASLPLGMTERICSRREGTGETLFRNRFEFSPWADEIATGRWPAQERP